MPEDGSPSPRLIRRTFVAAGRALGLLALIAGIYTVLAVLAPRLEDLPRQLIAVLAAVTIFESLRPSRRRAPAPAPAAAAEPPPSSDGATAELAEARAFISRLRDESMEREAALRRDSDELVGVNEGLRHQIDELREAVNVERAASAELRSREARLREEAKAESDHLQRAAGKALEEAERAHATAEQMRAENQKLVAEGARERQRAAEAVRESEGANAARHQQVAAAAQEIEKARGEIQRERQRADQAVRELQNALSAAATAATQRQKLESQIQEFERRLGAAMEELEALRAERQRVRREIEETRQRSEVEKRELRAAVEAESTAKLEEVVNRLTNDHEAAVRATTAAGEAALADVQSLTARLEDERRHASDIAAQRAALEQEITAQRETLEKEIAALRANAVDPQALRESIDAEWTAKLNKIVAGLAADHENDLGDAIAAREAARAEARAGASRIQEFEQQMSKEKQSRARLEEENTALKNQIAAAPAVDEKAMREAIELEWSNKLQTIVSHIASDHEADVGKAIEEREAARAEARNLAMKVTALQTRVRQAEQEIVSLRVSPSLPQIEPAAVPDADQETRGRANVLQIAEQANAAILAATSPGTVPLPEPERRPRVLFVHHDPTMRTMWRDSLQSSGFDVQTAADGLEGLRMTIATKPDVVIADASTPKMGGRELCQMIKSNQEIAGVKVILMTGVYTSEMPLEPAAGEFDPDEILRKPVKFEALKAALSNVLAAVQS